MKKLFITILLLGAMNITTFATDIIQNPETTSAPDLEETFPEETEVTNEILESSEKKAESEEEYCHIRIVTEFAEDVDPNSFTGYKVILTPVDLTYIEDNGIIPEDYKIPNTLSMNGEEYESYDLVTSGLTEYTAEVDIAGERVINIELTEPNIISQDVYTYTPFGDDFIEVDMGDIDPMGYFVGKTYLLKNEPGKEKTIHVLISHNPNPKKPDLNKVEVSKEDKKIVDAVLDGATDDVEIKRTVIDDIPETREEKNRKLLIIGLIIGGIALMAAAGYIIIKRIREEE